MKRFILICIFTITSFGFSIIANASSAQMIAIPGFVGSGVITSADMSSAVMQPASEEDDTIVAACVRTVTRSGEEYDNGVWYFLLDAQSGDVYVMTDVKQEYMNMSEMGVLPNHREKVTEFFECLVAAAENNE